ncbi:hypothetical protein BZG36_00552 [Bifiguratus adelaidae]|uniref:Enhancer of mRNA-decapping protein 4 C-terminal domain-containing protein n=1 Tax=Bifiguratus adelaidae TaxID=1938954 RepID=A0A261Y766_9FUNG|nr:hypothetical protein BZG36_00552 [Bifiguratus adelaidae]
MAQSGTFLRHLTKASLINVNLSCDTLISFGSSASDSAATVRWYPNVERTLLISTKYNIYLVQLDKLSGKDPVDLTATDSVDGIAKISPGQEIKSCTFSPDGSVIAIAFGTSISLWSLESLTEVHSIRSSPGDGNASEYSSIAFVPLPNGPARYILAGKQCNLVLQLWDLEGSRVEPVQELEFKCQSVDTSASFNAILFEPKVPSLLVANSSREAVFVITLQAGAGADVGEPNRSSSHESDADLCKRVASHNNMPDTTDNLSIAFQHISEILVKDPTISLAWTPTISKTDKFDFYALQETVVRLYHLPYNVIQPKDWQMAPVIEVEDASANVATVSLAQKSDSVHEETGPESTEHLIEAGTTSDVIASVERLKERRLSEHSATLKDGQTRADDDPLKEKLALNKNKTLKQVLGIRTPTPIVSPLVGPETDAQQASVPDISSGNEEEELMESAPVRSVDVSSSSSVADESLLATSKPVNGSKEVKQGRHRGNNENGAILEARVKSPTVNSPVLPQEGESLAENSHSQVEGAVLAKNLRKLEREILAGVDKIVQREMQQHRKQLAHERQANQNAENQRQQTLLRYVCSTLNNNTQKVLEQIIKQEIQNSVLPAISELANIQVEKAFGNQSTEKIAKTVALHVQKSLPTLKGDSKLSREAMDSITDSIQLAVFPAVDNAFRKMSADLEKRLLAKLEPLQQQQAQMTNLLQIMAQMQGSIEDMKRQLQEMQRNSGLVTSQPQPLHPRTPFNPNLTFAEPMMPPHLVAVNQEVDQAAMAGDWEEAFLKALQTADQAVIIRLCSKCDPGVVFGGNCQLSQPVLLSLLHHLSLDLGQQTDLRLTWMIDVLQALNPQDLEIAQPYAIVLPSVLQRVDEVQQQLSTQPGQEMTRQKMMYLAAIVRQRL